MRGNHHTTGQATIAQATIGQACSRARVAALLAAAVMGLGLGPGAAAPTGPVHDLATCRRLAETSPAEALVQARAWANNQGGEEAKLCQALALFNAGDFAGAGGLFEGLATAGVGVGKSARQLANLFDRAAWSWLRAGDVARAERLYGQALERLPEDSELQLDRGIARVDARRYPDAISDFTAVIRRQPKRADAWFFRAVAHRALDKRSEALADVEQALRLKPNDAEALVLRGALRAQAGDATGARLDWREVIRRDPQSALGKAAADNLSQLDRAESGAGGRRSR